MLRGYIEGGGADLWLIELYGCFRVLFGRLSGSESTRARHEPRCKSGRVLSSCKGWWGVSGRRRVPW